MSEVLPEAEQANIFSTAHRLVITHGDDTSYVGLAAAEQAIRGVHDRIRYALPSGPLLLAGPSPDSCAVKVGLPYPSPALEALHRRPVQARCVVLLGVPESFLDVLGVVAIGSQQLSGLYALRIQGDWQSAPVGAGPMENKTGPSLLPRELSQFAQVALLGYGSRSVPYDRLPASWPTDHPGSVPLGPYE